MWDHVLAVAARLVDRQTDRRRQSALATAQLAEADWNGRPRTLEQYQAVQMSSTPTGTIVLAAYNLDTRPNNGEIAVSSGGGKPDFVEVPALTQQPVLIASDYQGNSLKITNTGTAPIRVEIYAPGFGNAQPLKDNGAKLPLASQQIRTTTAATSFQQLIMTNPSGQTSFLFYAGPTPALYTVNASVPPNVPGIENHAVPGNTAKVMDNWNGETLYVANVSFSSDEATVTLLTF